MSHVFFALFEHPEAAGEALQRLDELGAEKEGFSFIVHRRALERQGNAELPLSETATASTVAKGAVLGALGGMVAGVLVAGPFGLVGAGPLAAALFGTTAGTAVGSISGLVAGATEPDATLAALSERIEDGHLVVTVETRSLANQEQAAAILRHHGARVVYRSVLMPTAA